jgi:hypothetical protein
MSAQAAGRAVANAGKAAGKAADSNVLNKGAKRDPELYVCSIAPSFQQRQPSNGINWWISILKYV